MLLTNIYVHLCQGYSGGKRKGYEDAHFDAGYLNVSISKDISNDTLVKYAFFYVFYPSTKLLKVIKKMEGMDQHPALGASVLQL